MGSWSGWGGMTGNDWTVQFGCWAKSEWKNLTGAAYSAANPESHKYERVPWEVGHVKTKVPGSGQQGEAEGGRRGSELWKFNLGERSTRSQARGQSRKMSCPSPTQPRWRFLVLPLTLTYTTLKDLRHSLLPHSCVVAALKEEPGKGRRVHAPCAKVKRGVSLIIITAPGVMTCFPIKWCFTHFLFFSWNFLKNKNSTINSINPRFSNIIKTMILGTFGQFSINHTFSFVTAHMPIVVCYVKQPLYMRLLVAATQRLHPGHWCGSCSSPTEDTLFGFRHIIQ